MQREATTRGPPTMAAEDRAEPLADPTRCRRGKRGWAHEADSHRLVEGAGLAGVAVSCRDIVAARRLPGAPDRLASMEGMRVVRGIEAIAPVEEVVS